MQLPEDFVSYTREMMGEGRFVRFLQALDQEPPVSIRLNPLKLRDEQWTVPQSEPVAWCDNGYYLSQRPTFTLDPLFHAGCYYVQEASSMFLAHVLQSQQSVLHTTQKALDLCAAPGGKSTLLRTLLPEGCVLFCNEPIRNRSNILSENIQKWGWPDCVVTSNFAKDFSKAKMTFDMILCDVPCSGEGMFRKDPQAVSEWSRQNVERCWRLQRDIVSDIWPTLSPGGLLVYSTCTFNTFENEQNVEWICRELGAELLAIPVPEAWHITGSLLPGFNKPVYRFIPGFTRGEGLFMAVLRKNGEKTAKDSKRNERQTASGLNILFPLTVDDKNKNAHTSAATKKDSRTIAATKKDTDTTAPHTVELSYQQAIAYLQRQALQLPADTPRGIVEVTFMGKVLGTCKNIGNRANNLYPQEWRIRTTHTSDHYDPVVVRTP